jgi:hypothetical protein
MDSKWATVLGTMGGLCTGETVCPSVWYKQHFKSDASISSAFVRDLHITDILSDTDKNDNCSPFSPSAPGNSLPETRFAYSISFVADGVNLLQGEGHIRYPDNEDFQSYALWIDDIGWGGVADHPLIPVVYQDDSVDEDDI